jgi:hypothetical protein
MNYVFILAKNAAFINAKNVAPLVPFLLHAYLPKVMYSEVPITWGLTISQLYIKFEISSS